MVGKRFCLVHLLLALLSCRGWNFMALHCKGELDVKEFVLIKVYFNNIVLVCLNYKEHLPSI